MKKLWQESQLFKDIHSAIYDDSYLWMVIHGPPRSSKTTLALLAAYAIYEDWDKVLEATVFTLPGLIHRIKNGKPERWPTTNGLHNRVPVIIYDDFGVHSNKADTQRSSAFDVFKGAFDALGTELGVLLATMVSASSATQQLQDKYNAEVTVSTKGKYKYDKVEWLQDYRGFKPRMKKIWIEDGTFEAIPERVYKEYDVMRHELVQEAFVRIEDALSFDLLENTLKMVKPADIELLKLIDKQGPIKYDVAKEQLGDEYKLTFTRCKARNLVIPTCMGGTYYKIDISSLGKDVLEEYERRMKERGTIKVKPYFR
jgi:hypothetical protein